MDGRHTSEDMARVSRRWRFSGLDQYWNHGFGCPHQIYEAGFVVADPTPEPLRDHQATVQVTHESNLGTYFLREAETPPVEQVECEFTHGMESACTVGCTRLVFHYVIRGHFG